MKHPPTSGRARDDARRRASPPQRPGHRSRACSPPARRAPARARPTLVWYINPDAGGQAKVAENCSTDEYTITTQVLPQDANEQRIQLARRLAAAGLRASTS